MTANFTFIGRLVQLRIAGVYVATYPSIAAAESALAAYRGRNGSR